MTTIIHLDAIWRMRYNALRHEIDDFRERHRRKDPRKEQDLNKRMSKLIQEGQVLNCLPCRKPNN